MMDSCKEASSILDYIQSYCKGTICEYFCKGSKNGGKCKCPRKNIMCIRNYSQNENFIHGFENITQLVHNSGQIINIDINNVFACRTSNNRVDPVCSPNSDFEIDNLLEIYNKLPKLIQNVFDDACKSSKIQITSNNTITNMFIIDQPSTKLNDFTHPTSVEIKGVNSTTNGNQTKITNMKL